MKYSIITVVFFLTFFALKAQNHRIFVWGGDINLKFTQYIVDLTGKDNPRLCYLPTASGDNPENIKHWEKICNSLKIDTLVLKVWVKSSKENKSFEEIILNSDAVVVGGGNTLNMIGIWKAQGIDKILKKALDKGIILSGGSAGSICWFTNGVSDSRPRDLSSISGLNFLPFSNCPHYSQIDRQKLYNDLIRKKKIQSGYAFDEKAGILFVNGKAMDIVTQSDKHQAYYICLKENLIKVEQLNARVILNNNSISENEYTTTMVGKKISEVVSNGKITPLSSYAIITQDMAKKNRKYFTSKVDKIFVFKNKIAGVVNDKYVESMGVYGLWYFYNNNGFWESEGEDIGGETFFECEIVFREKAKKILENAEQKYTE